VFTNNIVKNVNVHFELEGVQKALQKLFLLQERLGLSVYSSRATLQLPIHLFHNNRNSKMKVHLHLAW